MGFSYEEDIKNARDKNYLIFKLLIDYLIERGLIAIRNFSFWKV